MTVLAQVSTSVVDSPGWGAAEWVTVISAVSVVLGAIATLLVAVARLRDENRNQHDTNMKTTQARFDMLQDDLRSVNRSVGQLDSKVDTVAKNLRLHEQTQHRRRWWS